MRTSSSFFPPLFRTLLDPLRTQAVFDGEMPELSFTNRSGFRLVSAAEALAVSEVKSEQFAHQPIDYSATASHESAVSNDFWLASSDFAAAVDASDSRLHALAVTSLKGITPFVAVNDGFGGSGSREFAEPLNSIVAFRDDQRVFCSGVLIAPDIVLTARHCEINTSDQVVFGANLGNPDLTVGVSSVFLPGGPGIDPGFMDGADVAIVTLDSEVPGTVATPMRLVAETDALVGRVATIAGYGLNGVGSVGNNSTADGFRWGGQNIVDFYGEFGGGTNLFLADFDDGSEFGNTLDPIGSTPIPVELEAITSEGDSGSPLLVDVGGELAVAAVTSGGLDLWGMYGSFSFWTGIARFSDEISSFG